MASQKTSTRGHRPRLLYTSATSLLTIARRAYRKAEELNGPVGPTVRAAASVASPILQPLQHQCLSVLSFLDDKILAVEDRVANIIPPSSYIFSKVDELAIIVETLPEKFDGAMNHTRELIHKLPLMDWTMEKVILVLQSLISAAEKLILALESSISAVYSYPNNERDIMVDINSDEQAKLTMDAEIEGKKQNEIGKSEKEAKKQNEMDEEEAMRARKVEEDIREVETTCMEILGALEKMEMVEEDGGGGEGLAPPLAGRELVVGNEAVTPSEAEAEAGEVGQEGILEMFDEGWVKGVKGQ